MENLSNWEMVGIVFLVLIFGGLIIRIAKNIFKFVIIGVLIVVGIYIVKPELLDKWFGKEVVEDFEEKIKDGSNELKPHIKDGLEKIEEVVDTLKNKL